jgi:hypothetical protein
LATGLKTFTQQQRIIGKATKATKAASTAGVTPEAKLTPDDALAVLESDIQKSFGDDAGRVFDLADELMSKGVATDRAAALAQATKEVAQQKAADVQAAAETEAETAVIPEPTETVQESADKIAEAAPEVAPEVTAALAPEVAPEAGERSEAYMAVKAMKDKIDDLMRQSSEAQDEIMSIGRTKRGSSNDKRKQELLEKRNTLDRETGDLLFKFDKAKDEYIKNNPEEVARIQAEKAAAAPAPEVTAEPTPEVTPEAADADTRIRYYLGDKFASAISSRPAQEQVALTKQVTETLDQIDQLEKNRTVLRAQNDQASIKAVTEQIRKLENSLDDLEYSLTETPNTREQVQEAIKANGNATEANKISTDIRKDMCD